MGLQRAPPPVAQNYGRPGAVGWYDLRMSEGMAPAGRDSYALEVAGGVSGQVVVGSHNVLISAAQGSSVTVRSGGPPAVRRRTRPVGRPLPRSRRAFAGRAEEVARVRAALEEGRPVQVWGPAGIGKSALLREVAARRVGDGHDVVFLSAAGLPVDDLAQEVFQACYEAEDYRPEPARLRRLMGSVQALLVVDDFTGSAEELAALLDAVPGCDVLLASPTASVGEAGLALELGGLDEEAARLLAGPGASPEFLAAARGHPAALLRGRADAAGVAAGDAAVDAAVAARLTEPARRALAVLCAVEVGVSAEVLAVLAGTDDGAVAELTGAGLAEADPRGFRASAAAASVLSRVRVAVDEAGFAAVLASWVGSGATLRAVADAAPVVLFALRAAASGEEHAAVRDLARAAAPALARTLRWGVWRKVLELGGQAARRLGSAVDEAYFAHEEGVRRRAVGMGLAAGGSVAAALAVGKGLGGGAAGGQAGTAKAGGVKAGVLGKPAVIAGAAAAVVVAVATAALSFGGAPQRQDERFAGQDTGMTTAAPDGQAPPQGTTTDPAPQSGQSGQQDRLEGPPTQDTFPARTQAVGVPVHADGFAIRVDSAQARRVEGLPEMLLETVVTNQLWSSSSAEPPAPQLRTAGGDYQGSSVSAQSYPRGQAVPTRFAIPLDERFRWEGAVLRFPVGRAQAAAIFLDGSAAPAALAPLPVTLHGSSATSGRVRLDFLPGAVLRPDAAMDAEPGCCPDRESPAPEGLSEGKAGLKLYFAFQADTDMVGFNFGVENFTLTLPNGRVVQPDHGPILAVYPESAHHAKLSVATQVDLPAEGTYTLTVVDRDGRGPVAPPATVTFTVG